MATLRHLSLRSAVCLRRPDIHLWTSWKCSSLWKSVRLHERRRRYDTDSLSMLATLVRESLRPCTSRLFDARLTRWPTSHRRVLRHRSIHFRFHRLSYGLRRLSFSPFRRRNNGGPIHVSRLSSPTTSFSLLHMLAVVGDHVPLTSLCS